LIEGFFHVLEAGPLDRLFFLQGAVDNSKGILSWVKNKTKPGRNQHQTLIQRSAETQTCPKALTFSSERRRRKTIFSGFFFP
jgi:hypothetical protein